jgi:hypothetical protein
MEGTRFYEENDPRRRGFREGLRGLGVSVEAEALI